MKKILLILFCFIGLLSKAQMNTSWFNSYNGEFDPKITISVLVYVDGVSLTYTTKNGSPAGFAQILFAEAGGTCNNIPTYTSYVKLGGLGMDITQTLSYNYTEDFTPGIMYTAIGAVITPLDTIWSNSVCFVAATPATSPTVTTNSVTSVTASSANVNCSVTNNGGSSITSYGVYYRRSDVGTYTLASNTGSATNYTVNITGLSSNSTYYTYAFATNSVGTGFGSTLTFNTPSGGGTPPTVTTSSITNITSSSATGGGNVTSEGSSMVTSRGVQWSLTSDFATILGSTMDGAGTGGYSSSITGLNYSSIYYVKAYAINSAGISYGSIVNFTTSAQCISNILAQQIAFPSGGSNPIQISATVTDSNGCYDPIKYRYVYWNSTGISADESGGKSNQSLSYGQIISSIPFTVGSGSFWFGLYVETYSGHSSRLFHPNSYTF